MLLERQKNALRALKMLSKAQEHLLKLTESTVEKENEEWDLAFEYAQAAASICEEQLPSSAES